MLRREVIKSQQDILVFFKALDGLRVLVLIEFNEEVEGLLCLHFCRSHPDVMNMVLGFWCSVLGNLLSTLAVL